MADEDKKENDKQPAFDGEVTLRLGGYEKYNRPVIVVDINHVQPQTKKTCEVHGFANDEQGYSDIATIKVDAEELGRLSERDRLAFDNSLHERNMIKTMKLFSYLNIDIARTRFFVQKYVILDFFPYVSIAKEWFCYRITNKTWDSVITPPVSTCVIS